MCEKCKAFMEEYVGKGSYEFFYEVKLAPSLERLIKEQHSVGRMVAM